MKFTRLTASLLFLSAPLLHADEKAEAPAEKKDIPEGLVPITPQQSTQFAFLCLKDKTMGSEADIKKALAKWFQLKDESEIVRFTQDKEKGTMSWTIGRARFVATLAEYSIPKPDIQYAAANSLHWPDAEKILLEQQAHYTVSCTSIYPEPWMTAMALSKAIGALAETHVALGIYWGDASIVHNPASFLKLAQHPLSQDDKDIPSSLWVGILLEKHKDGTMSGYTDGLRVLGHMELEIQNSKESPQQVYSILSTLSSQIINGRKTIEDNSEISSDEGRGYKAKYGASAIDRPQKVVLISR